MSIKAIFFDIDNTLYDSTTLSSMARKNSVLAMIDAGLDRPEAEVLKKLYAIINQFGANYHKHYDELLKEYGMSDPRIIAAGVVAYEHTKNAYLKPFPGVVPTLMELKKRYRLGVISNGLTIKQWEKLIGLRLHHFFEVVVTSEQCRCEKPAPGIFEAALRTMDVDPGDGLMVGDKYETDILGAQKAGMQGLLLTRMEAKNTNEINRFSQILEWLGD